MYFSIIVLVRKWEHNKIYRPYKAAQKEQKTLSNIDKRRRICRPKSNHQAITTIQRKHTQWKQHFLFGCFVKQLKAPLKVP